MKGLSYKVVIIILIFNTNILVQVSSCVIDFDACTLLEYYKPYGIFILL